MDHPDETSKSAPINSLAKSPSWKAKKKKHQNQSAHTRARSESFRSASLAAADSPGHGLKSTEAVPTSEEHSISKDPNKTAQLTNDQGVHNEVTAYMGKDGDVDVSDKPKAEPSSTGNLGPPESSEVIVSKNMKGLQLKSKEPGGYIAPSGFYMPPAMLHEYSRGVMNEKGDNVIFLPDFLENPWEGLEIVLTDCESRPRWVYEG